MLPIPDESIVMPSALEETLVGDIAIEKRNEPILFHAHDTGEWMEPELCDFGYYRRK